LNSHVGKNADPSVIGVFVCKTCGKEFEEYKCKKPKYCSQECNYAKTWEKLLVVKARFLEMNQGEYWD
jgi:predicted metal-binding protein